MANSSDQAFSTNPFLGSTGLVSDSGNPSPEEMEEVADGRAEQSIALQGSGTLLTDVLLRW